MSLIVDYTLEKQRKRLTQKIIYLNALKIIRNRNFSALSWERSQKNNGGIIYQTPFPIVAKKQKSVLIIQDVSVWTKNKLTK